VARNRAEVSKVDRTTIMIVVAAAMSAVGIVGDYFLKRASGEASPLVTPAFLVGLALYSSTAFAWVFVMSYLKLATIGAIYSVCMILMLTGMGFLLFDETLNRNEIAGIVLAIASIILLSRFG
jgi:drug/metabolite transporter (DMT)-like permease